MRKLTFLLRQNLPVFLVALFLMPFWANAQSTLNCQTCHAQKHELWLTGKHANTQDDVAEELASEWIGLPPDSVILGSEAENCIACHGPIAVTANGGMNEVQTLHYFFSTTNGVFTDSTHSMNSAEWPHVFCTTCHNVPDDHPSTMPKLAIFNSTTVQYDSIGRTAQLCGQCHGTLRFSDTDHRVFDAWKMSRHGHGGQEDVAGELAEEWAGVPPDSVINGSEAEDCIACHAPTAIQANGGMSEVEALNHFFTTENGKFTENTAPQNANHWPDVSCTTCHNPHKPDTTAIFDSKSDSYKMLSSAQELCGQCHGNLRFEDTDHLSYNMEAGTGGIGVDDQLTMPGVKCVDCHMHVGETDDTNAAMFGGHSWSVFIKEEDGSESASCTSCHSGMDAKAARAQVEKYQEEFAELDSIAQMKLAKADSAMEGNTDPTKEKYLEEAHYNLFFAESDESGGFHNHKYSMALLNDVVEKADMLTGLGEPTPTGLTTEFALFQNYPNPFNASTTIRFRIKKPGNYALTIYNVQGQKVRVIFNRVLANKEYRQTIHLANLASGIYYYELKGEGFRQMRKFIYLK